MQLLAGSLLKLRAAHFKSCDIDFGRERSLALRQEKVAPEAGLHLDPVTDVAEIGDFLQQDEFHDASSVLIGVRQEREEARTFDRDRELPLIEGLRTRDAARYDLAGLGNVALQGRKILVVDRLHAFGGEAAEFLAPRKAARGAAGFHNQFPRLGRSSVMAVSSASAATGSSRTRSRRRPPSSSSDDPCASSRGRSRRPPASSSSAFAMCEGSTTASSTLVTRWRSTASLKRKAPVNSSTIFWSHSMFIRT